jgi:TnpA family transposase
VPARLSITKAQRDALLALPTTEDAFVRHYELSAKDRPAVNHCRTPETKLAFALQLCVLRYPGRVLQRGEFLPEALVAFVADQGRYRPTRSRGLPADFPPDTSSSRCCGGPTASPT